MTRIIVVLIVLAVLPSAAAQPTDVLVAGQRVPLHITVSPLHQSLEHGGRSIAETTVPVAVYLPLRRDWGIGFWTAWAEVSGDGLASVSGPADVQAYVSHYRSVGKGSVVATFGLNIPSGKQGFTQEEYRTLTLISRNEYAFRTPSFGLGLGVSPGLSIAVPLSDHIVVGLGAAYQYRGAFDPLENMVQAYRPGNELLMTGGIDVRLYSSLSFSTDWTYTAYRPDRVGDVRVLEAGDKIVAGAQVRYTGHRHQLRLQGRYRSRGRNSIAAAGGDLVEERVKTFPDQISVYVSYRSLVGRAFYATLLGELRHFEPGPVILDLQNVYGGGIGLEMAMSLHVRAVARFLYQFGDLTGIEAGFGLNLRLY